MKLPTFVELDTLDTQQLRNLNRLIVEIIRDRAAQRQVEAGRAFQIGDIAAFNLRGREIRFRVARINVQSLSGPQVDADGNVTGRKARAAPSLCYHIAQPLTQEDRKMAVPIFGHTPIQEAPPVPVPVRRRMRLPS